MSRKQPKRTAGNMAKIAIVGFFIFAIVGSVGLGVASAAPDDELARARAFGFDSATNESTLTSRATNSAAATSSSNGAVREQSMLVSTSQRNVDNGLKMIDEKEYDDSVLDEAIVFMNTGKQAARIHCATMGWTALKEMLEDLEKKGN